MEYSVVLKVIYDGDGTVKEQGGVKCGGFNIFYITVLARNEEVKYKITITSHTGNFHFATVISYNKLDSDSEKIYSDTEFNEFLYRLKNLLTYGKW